VLLSGSIGRGNSLHDVEELIGPGVPLIEDAESHREALRETAQWHPDSYPDGVFDADVFLTWSGNDEKVTLQFRNGHLLNYEPEQFTTFRPAHDVAGQTGHDNHPGMEPALTIAGQKNSTTPIVRPNPIRPNSTVE